MHYSTEIIINLPMGSVIEIFNNPANLQKWQPDLMGFEHLAGEPGQQGAKSRLTYKMGRRKIEMIETITQQNLPEYFEVTYAANGIWNKVSNRFLEVGAGQTKWISDNEFVCSGFFKWLAFFMPGLFKKKTKKYMMQFKSFAEGIESAPSL